MSKKPPHTGIVNLSGNPPDPDDHRRRSRKEEERRLKAAAAHVKYAAKHGLPPQIAPLFKIGDLPGEIEPDAQPSELAKKIETKAAPKLLEISRRSAGRVKLGKVKLPDGKVLENVDVIGPSVTKITLSFQELGEILQRVIDPLVEMKDAVIGFCSRVFSAAKVVVAGGAEFLADDEQHFDLDDEPLEKDDPSEDFDDSDENGFPIDDSDGE